MIKAPLWGFFITEAFGKVCLFLNYLCNGTDLQMVGFQIHI